VCREVFEECSFKKRMMRKFVQKKLTLLILLLTGTVCSFSQTTSNKGREFWVGYGHHQYMESGSNAMNMRLYFSTEEQGATVTVTIDSLGNEFLPINTIGGLWKKTYVIPPYTAIQSDIIPKGTVNVAAAAGDVPSDPWWDARLWSPPNQSGGTGGSGKFEHKGIHIESSAPITAYAHIYGSASSGATMLIPVTAWGYEYVSLNSNQSYASNCFSWAYVIAYKDNTVLEITPSVKTRGQNRTGLSPNTTTTVTLMKGQIYQLVGANLGSDVDGNDGTNSSGYELSGTRIRSIAGPTGECYPIAVFSGSSRTSNVASCGSGGGDNDNQQLFPMHSWGKKYLTAPFSPAATANGAQTSIVKIAFSEPPPATVVKRNGTVLSIPAGSKFYTYESNTADLIEADKPIMINQFMTGGACNGGGLGDPEMVVVAPVEQAIKNVTFYRQSRENIVVNYLTLIVPTAGLGSLRIDNSSTFDYVYAHPRSALMPQPYSVVVKRWAIGAGQGYQCNVKCDSAFNAITYGLGSVESYAYSAGAYINNLNSLSGLHNQPDTSNGGNDLNLFTGVATPIDLSILVRYQPDRLTWKFSEMTPNTPGCMTSVPALAGDYIMNPASTFYQGSIIKNGLTYYHYQLPQSFTFHCPGIYEIPVEAYSPGINNCGNRETFYVTVEVKARPIINYTFSHPTKCTKDTIYLTGPTSGLSGTTPMVINQWKWLLPGGITGTRKDTAVVLPAGTHQIRLVGVTDEGLLSDTVTKTFVVHPPPTLVFDAVPDTVCLGQAINFTQTATYGDPTIPIINHYWNFGDNTPVLNGMITSQSHTYAAAGTYIATGAVRVSTLCVSDTSYTTVHMSPEALLSLTYPTGCLPTSGVAQFTAAPTDLGGIPIVSYNWNFGDPASGANNTSTAQNPTHTYSNFGTYPVTLSVVTSTGCGGDTTINMTFGVKPALTFQALNAVCVSAAPLSVNYAAVTNGVSGTGTYSGPGITNATAGTFSPSLAGPGTHTITYSFVTPACTETITQTITVNALPTVSAGTYAGVCVNAPAVALTGTPAGGTFSGTGVSGTSFNPATAGVGTHIITYTYTDPNGCANAATSTITVNALPTVNAGTYAALCINAAPISLIGTPAGGTFTGPGVSGSNFNPATAGAGTHTITYSYTNANGCTNTTTTSITVNALPGVNAGTYAAVCINAGTVALIGTPVGGTFSGTGVSGTTFNPATAGGGTHTITYNFTAATGCTNSSTTTITVNALPTVNAGTYAAVCINAANITLAGTPAGGTFSGPGVTGTTFSPSSAGIGTHTITFNYTAANGCANSATTSITVYSLPTVNAGTYTAVCVDGAPVTLAGTPTGGTFSGPGVTGNSFNPGTAGAGTHTLTYSYTDAGGCSNTGTTTITVNPLPVLNAGTYASVCVNGASVTLAGTPAGGTFSGPGVTGNSFNPATAGVGTHTITYGGVGGCNNTITTSITVNPIPVVSAGTYATVCVNGASVTLAGTPAGGTFSGPGVTGNSFNPVTAGAGTHTITYNYTAATGCSNSATTSITVDPLPTVSAGTYTGVCINSSAVTLAGTPAGGTFSGPGVTGNSFNPATAGVGTHTITYSFTNANGCTNTGTTTITVNALPVVNAGTYAAVCVNGSAVTLAGTPAGGTFSGPGVTGNSFNPATAGVGTHTITYNYTDANSCSNTTTTTITVNPLPVVTAGTYAPVCVNAAAVALAGTPAGGTFSGTGVSGNSFNPATAGAGTHTITYTYTNANGCTNTGTTTIIVNPLPVVTAGTYTSLCEDGTSITLVGTPAGGTFSGPGVTGSSFNPVTAGVGTHTITYSYTDGNGCSNTATTTITVNPLPTAAAGIYPAVCFESSPITLNGAPGGGTFSGPGVSGNVFNPSVAGAGIHNIVYSYTSTAGCSRTNSTTIEVFPRPTASFSMNNSICLDGNTTLTNTSTISAGSITTWNWNLGDGNTPSYPNGNPFNVSYANANSYTVQLVTISDKGCVSLPATQTVKVNALPVVNFDLPGNICMPGGSAQFANKTTISDGSSMTYAWDFGDGNNSGSTNPSHLYAGSGSYNVTLVATSQFGCVGQQTKTLSSFFDKPVAAFSVSPQEICQGADNNFTDASTSANSTISSWSWNFKDGTNSTSTNPVKKFTLPGTYDVQLVVTNAAGCASDPFILPVTVHLQPKIEAGPSFVVPMGTQIQFGASANSAGLNFTWSPPLGLSDPNALKPTLVANADQVYTLTATGEYGCTAVDNLSVKILKPVVVPNIFTPNGDNIHDRWVIQNIADYPGASVEVFNRYGQQVYFSAGYATPWDGKYKGKDMPVGTYYYIIKLNNGFKMLNGSVTIVR
jgi:gliding motility-associated-like protein